MNRQNTADCQLMGGKKRYSLPNHHVSCICYSHDNMGGFSLCTSTFASEVMNAQKLQTIRGYVQALPPVAGHADEDAAKVAVITDDGTQYHVLHKGAGIGLLDDINANVEVTGYVSRSATEDAGDAEFGPHHILTVKSYRLTDGFDDPWYDDTVR